jgi:hypothetical protein
MYPLNNDSLDFLKMTKQAIFALLALGMGIMHAGQVHGDSRQSCVDSSQNYGDFLRCAIGLKYAYFLRCSRGLKNQTIRPNSSNSDNIDFNSKTPDNQSYGTTLYR